MNGMGSRLPGFHRIDREERVRILARWLDEDAAAVSKALSGGGLDVALADTLVENVVGTFGLPFGVATNFVINGEDRLIPMVTEEPSVVAAASHAARLVRQGGGFRVNVSPSLMVCQVQVFAPDLGRAREAIRTAEKNLLATAAAADPRLVEAGGGPVAVEVRTVTGDPGEAFLVVHLVVDCQDAMGANTVNTMGEAIAPMLATLTGGRCGLKIVTNLADRRLARVEAFVPLQALHAEGFTPEEVRDGIAAASRFAELDPYRAATHNKGIMNGTDAVVVATGNDWRAVEAGAHAHAARTGRYAPLCTWRVAGEGLRGELEMPLAVGMVGGATRVHPAARLAIRVLRARRASDIAAAAAAAGMANNLAALRALATEGIQKGHMRLHSRSRRLER